MKNENEEIVGGITGITFWHHVHVDFLWVSEEYIDTKVMEPS